MSEAAADAARDQHSYRRILVSTSIIGGATLLVIIVGIVRTKILALLAGPEGIGLLGVLTNVSSIVTTIAGFGLATSAVRDLAAADSPLRKAEIRRALWVGSIPLSILGALLLWLYRVPVAALVTDNDDYAFLIGLSGIAIVLGIVAAAQQAVLQGLQRIQALSAVRVAGAIGATLLAIPAVWWFGTSGMVAVVIAVPLATVVSALFFRTKLAANAGPLVAATVATDVRTMAALGAALTFTGTVQMLSQAAVRTLVVQQGGLEQAGLLQAVLAITTMNITLVLGAMSADYFPRLSAAAGQQAQANAIVNNQLHVALLLGAPLILAMNAGAPLVLSLLYSSDFGGAETMLRWQLIGDLLKIPGWAFGFVLLARGDRGAYVLVELLFAFVYGGASYLLVPHVGLDGAGLAYLAAYLVYGIVIALVCHRRFGVVMSRDNIVLLAAATVASGGIKLLSDSFALGALILGGLLAAGFALYAFRELKGRAGLSARST